MIRPSFLALALASVLALVLIMVVSASAGASVVKNRDALLRGFDLDAGACNGAEGRADLVNLRDRIGDSPSLEEARSLALEQTRLARKALSRARWVLPFNGAVGNASKRLDAYEVRVEEAGSPEEVAAAFGNLVRLASSENLKIVDAGLFDDKACDFTTGEIIVIVIGLLLGIIPGLIFMAIFC